MIKILYEDDSLVVVNKPAGMESQSARGFAADVVSELKMHRMRELSTDLSTKRTGVRGKACGKPMNQREEPYIGVIHRLDKPVGGVMVYAKTPKAANLLSEQVKQHKMIKIYHAVVCGRLVDNVGNYVDNLLKDGKTNTSRIVAEGTKDSRRAELSYRALEEIERQGEIWTLAEIHLHTGRHHQIRVQFAGHGHPLWGDNKYNPLWGGTAVTLPAAGMSPEPAAASLRGLACEVPSAWKRRGSLALCAVSLSFIHPDTGEVMTFRRPAAGGGFDLFRRDAGAPDAEDRLPG